MIPRLFPVTLLLFPVATAFQQSPVYSATRHCLLRQEIPNVPILSSLQTTKEESVGDEEENEHDFEILFEDDEPETLDEVEKAWRYVKKPLLSIGAKGAKISHGNSLRQLLDSHTAVKVKVNTNKFGKFQVGLLL